MSTLKVGTIQSQSTTLPPTIQTSSGTEVGTFCRAWVNFDGTGTVVIRADFNVASITDNAVGDYTVVIDTDLPDANYSAVFGVMTDNAVGSGANFQVCMRTINYPTAGTIRVYTGVPSNGVLYDTPMVNVSIFR